MTKNKITMENGSTITLVSSDNPDKWQGIPSNADKLREYKLAYGLNSKKVAILLDVSLKTVECWLISPDSSNYRPMADREIKFIHCLLKRRKKINKP